MSQEKPESQAGDVIPQLNGRIRAYAPFLPEEAAETFRLRLARLGRRDKEAAVLIERAMPLPGRGHGSPET